MKKTNLVRLLSLLLIPIMLISFVSCKKDKEKEEEEFKWDPYPYEDLGAFLTLPDYKSFTISQSYIDNEINATLAGLYGEQQLYIDVTDGRGAKAWDSVKIEFSSIVVGDETVYPAPEAGDGGGEPTAIDEEGEENKDNSKYSFVLGTGEALAEIEAAVTGMTLNSEKETSFTFPEDYAGKAEYAGKEATLKFKLISLAEPPELTADLCYRFTPYPNPETLYKSFEQEIIYSEFWKYVFESSVLKATPEKEYNEYYNGFINIFKDYAKSNNKTLEEYVVTEGQNFPSYGLYQGITVDEFYKIAREYAEENIKNDLILYSLIKAENLQTSGALYEAAQKELLLSSGIGYTIESLENEYGKTQIVTSIMDIQVRKQVLKSIQKTA